MKEEVDPSSSQLFATQKYMDLTLYFRELEIKKTKSVSCIEIYHNNLYLGTKEFQVYAYDIKQGEEDLKLDLFNQRCFPAQCTSVEFIVASEKFLIVVPSRQQQLIRIWSRQTLQLLHGYYGHDKQISSIVYLNDGRHMVSCSYDCSVRIWDLSQNFQFDKEIRKFQSVFPILSVCELSEDTVAFGGDDCLITVWNWKTEIVKHKCYAHLGSTTSLRVIAPNLMYSTGGDSKIKVWKFGEQQPQTSKYLNKLEQFKKKLNQNIFTTNITQSQILSIDSKGHMYLMNNNLQIGSSKLKITYCQSIRSIKLWRTRLFVVIVNNGKGELKEIAADFEQLRRNAKKKLDAAAIKQIQQSQMNFFDLKIVWKKLTLTDPKTGAKILNHLNGYVESGSFLTIMGPSGAGKSSLLSILTCRLRDNNSKLQIQGHCEINGQSYGLSTFSKLAAYVQQDDVMFGTLTVRQTFLFHAQLKLWDYTLKEQEDKCDQLLKKLNLFECKDVLIGNNQFKKCISGGQKKRVAIGVELLSNPKILVFDEPTSGLDSYNALNITRLLSKLAKEEKKLIIATIHQPSTLIFQEMDELYLLKAGECIYTGKANKIVPYMQSLGINVNYHMNPADFFMLEVSSLKEQSGYKTSLNRQNCLKNTVFPQQYHEIESDRFKPLTLRIDDKVSAPFCQQFKPLVMRSFRNFIRTPSNQLNKLVTALLIPIFLGLLYSGIGDDIKTGYDQTTLFNFFCFLFMSQFFVFSMNIYDTALVFPVEKQIVCKQAGGNLYSIIIYFIARLCTELFGCILPAIICGVLIYLAGDLNLSVEYFGVFMGIFVILAVSGYLFGMMFGVLNKDAEQSITILPLAVIPILIFGGLVVNTNDIPVYSSWIQYLSPLRHAFMIVFQNQLKSSQFIFYQPFDIAQLYGLNGETWVALGCLVGLLGVYFCLSLVFLFIIKKKI